MRFLWNTCWYWTHTFTSSLFCYSMTSWSCSSWSRWWSPDWHAPCLSASRVGRPQTFREARLEPGSRPCDRLPLPLQLEQSQPAALDTPGPQHRLTVHSTLKALSRVLAHWILATLWDCFVLWKDGNSNCSKFNKLERGHYCIRIRWSLNVVVKECVSKEHPQNMSACG